LVAAAAGAGAADRQLLRRTVPVPSSEISFAVPLSQCSGLPPAPNACSRLLGVEEVIEQSLAIILEELPKVTTAFGIYRCPPLVFSRLARGGKSTVLNEIFKQLQLIAINCIIITFNGNGGFQTRSGESQKNSILRLIAAQLVTSCSPEQKFDIECDERALDVYIGGEPFVLIIDELNALSNGPIDFGAGQLLRTMFLDRPNRYLVFSTHIPLDVDDNFSSLAQSTGRGSMRGCKVVPMPVEADLRKIWTMDGCDRNVAPAEVALYGGIPSLIYSVKGLAELRPSDRFASTRFSAFDASVLMNELVSELVDGTRSAMHTNLRVFDSFSSVPKFACVQWPLCYVKGILNMCAPTHISMSLAECITNLETHCQIVEHGLDWEIIVQIALILRCCYGRRGYPFHDIENYVPDEYHPVVAVRKLYANNSNSAHAEIQAFCEHLRAPTLVVFTPAYAKFPLFDGFVAFHNPGKNLYVLGVQMKLGRAVPKARGNTFRWVSKGYLVRGLPAGSSYETDFWHYLSSDEINNLLGFSLGALQPRRWPAVPLIDNFDAPL
jgi:hypothetical protein